MPSVALHVVEFTFYGGFESLTLRHLVCGPEKVLSIFQGKWQKMPHSCGLTS
jgi:hypothetical protein